MTQYTIYVDGSFNSHTTVYGGAYLMLAYDQDTLSLNKSNIGYFEGNHPEIVSQQQIAGECGAMLIALSKLSKQFSPNNDTVEVRFDYIGIEKWAKNLWKAKKPVSKDYIKGLAQHQPILQKSSFTHIRGHTGEWGNEFVDKLAKFAVGVNKTMPAHVQFKNSSTR